MKWIIRIALVSFVALVAVFMTGPVFYGAGSMLVDAWREILPYSLTHSGDCSYHGLHHGHHRIILEQK